MLEFLWMNKLMGDENYDQFSKWLLSASILKIKNQEISLKKNIGGQIIQKQLYHRKKYQKYFELTKKSVDMMTTDEPKKDMEILFQVDMIVDFYHQLLDRKPVNFTVTFSRNLEFQTTKEISKILGCEHVHLLCSKNHFEKNF